MYYTYVLISKRDNNFYTGYTNNLFKRLKEHHQGKVLSTKFRIPFKLIYYEVCSCQEDAKAREKYLKSGMGSAILKID